MEPIHTSLLDWHAASGRKDLPWQQNITPYRVWVSEIMLQQTQVTTVIDYYNRFMARFPNVERLAGASLDEVLHLWTGLGYYARGRNLHKTARIVAQQHAGEFPSAQAELESLPGIGRSTAGAIRAIAFNERGVILDGNVKRVLTRLHALEGHPGESRIARELWQLAEFHTPQNRTATYTQAIMDLGATVCTRRRPTCDSCPLSDQCRARLEGNPEAYPTRKPGKDKPLRQARFFILTSHAGAVYLERRPLNGLWGGLWTPPERPSGMQASQFLAELGLRGIPTSRVQIQPPLRHAFTHFHLDATPVYITIDPPTELLVADREDTTWVSSAELTGANAGIGLSALAVKLLAPTLEEITDEQANSLSQV